MASVSVDADVLLELTLIVRTLVRTPPIFYDTEIASYCCRCCFARMAWTLGDGAPPDVAHFPHERVCPVARALRVENAWRRLA